MNDNTAERPAVTWKTPPVLFEKTQAQIAAIEDVLGEPLLVYWNSTAGSVCMNDVLALHTMLRGLGRVPKLSLFVKSGGGSGEASLRMAHLLRQNTEDLTVLVPLQCASAATMLALGANRIAMGPLAHLSAVDTAVTHDLSPLDRDNHRVQVSQDELHRVARLWRDAASGDTANPYASLYGYVHPLVIGAVDRSSALSTRLCIEILSYHMADRAKAEAVSNTLNSAYPSHSYPITQSEAARIGLNVQDLDVQLNDMLLELNELYSEMGQKASTDIDERNSHDESIVNIIESRGVQMFYKYEKDWHYRTQERRWISLNDHSRWHRAELTGRRVSVTPVHIR